MAFGYWSCGQAQYYEGDGGGFPQVRAVMSLVILCLLMAHPCTKMFQLCINQLVWFREGLCEQLKLFINLPSPIPKLQSVASQGSCPNSFSFYYLHLWTRNRVHQGVWGCVKLVQPLRLNLFIGSFEMAIRFSCLLCSAFLNAFLYIVQIHGMETKQYGIKVLVITQGKHTYHQTLNDIMSL